MDPLQKIINGDVKSDLGFYYHEDSHDEVGFQIDTSSLLNGDRALKGDSAVRCGQKYQSVKTNKG